MTEKELSPESKAQWLKATSAEQIVDDVYDGLSVKQVRNLIAFARTHHARGPG